MCQCLDPLHWQGGRRRPVGHSVHVPVCVYYCITYYKAVTVRVGPGGIVVTCAMMMMPIDEPAMVQTANRVYYTLLRENKKGAVGSYVYYNRAVIGLTCAQATAILDT